MAVFAARRAAFSLKMDSNAVAIFPSKPVYLRNLDIDYPYRQESNFYYLSGFEEPHSLILLNPRAEKYKYILFVQRRNARRETYEGRRAGIGGAMETFRADTAFYIDQFSEQIRKILPDSRKIYYTFGINPEFDRQMRELFIERRSRSNWPIEDPGPLVAQLRLIKNEGDFRMGLEKAVEISARAHIEAFKSIEPGMYEREVQAVFEYVFRKMGSPRNGYACIIGSGPNSCILHYDTNTRQMKDGDVVLMDCAAEYGYYSADITRTVPVNGRFSREQKQIYQIVLNAQNAAIEMVKPGVVKTELDQKINNILGEGLFRLGFLKDKKDFKIFTLHGYAHWIGLDVHDVGGYFREGKSYILQPGMVFTVEPGIYIRPEIFQSMKDIGYSDDDIAEIKQKIKPYMNIGVRIEDDILVTGAGHRNLSAAVPREISKIEKMMRKTGIGNIKF